MRLQMIKGYGRKKNTIQHAILILFAALFQN